jgi:hypothetical protein
MLSALLDSRWHDKETWQENLPSAFGQLQVMSKFGDTSKKIWQSRLPRKTSKLKLMETVPKTDTGGWVEKTKANE